MLMMPCDASAGDHLLERYASEVNVMAAAKEMEGPRMFPHCTILNDGWGPDDGRTGRLWAGSIVTGSRAP